MSVVERYLACIFATSLSFTDATRFCDFYDPCEAALTYLPFSERRTDNCDYKQDHKCDDLISSSWYKTDELMLNYCPGKSSCGTLYPIWLNGSEPSVSDGVVERNACLVGATCCDRIYNIKIKNCTSFQAYCLGSTSGCPERYCFGRNGSCLDPTTTSTMSPSPTSVDLDTQTTEDNKGRYVSHERSHVRCLTWVTAIPLIIISMVFGGGIVLIVWRVSQHRNNVIQVSDEHSVSKENGKGKKEKTIVAERDKWIRVVHVEEPPPEYREKAN